MSITQLTCISFLFTLSFSLNGQGDIIGLMQVQGKVLEQLDKSRKGVAGIKVYIAKHGEAKTDGLGAFEFEIPVYKENKDNPQIKVEIEAPGYTLIHPLDGIQVYDPAVLVLKINILVCGSRMDKNTLDNIQNYQQKIRNLSTTNHRLRHKQNELNEKMLDTIQFFTNQQIIFEKEILALKKQMEKAGAENRELAEKLETSLRRQKTLQDSIQTLVADLYLALEEKYHKQEQYFKAISSALADYLLRVKDIRDFLPNTRDHATRYSNPLDPYVKPYNRAFENIYNNSGDYQQGVEHYWQNAGIHEELNRTIKFILEDIHQKTLIYNIRTINSLLGETRFNKAQKAATETHKKLAPLVKRLESETEAIIKALQNNF